MTLRVKEFEREDERRWDHFVRSGAVNGTIFHTRNFLNYHPDDRFQDRSILLFENDRLICVVPAADDDASVFSHPGSTYGGPVIANGYYNVKRLFPVLQKIYEYYGENIGMRIAPSMYGHVLNDPITFYYGRAMEVRRELAVYKDLTADCILESVRRERQQTAVRKKRREDFEVAQTEKTEHYEIFYDILTSNLDRHDVQPTHTLQELLSLKKRLNDQQILFVGRKPDGKIVSGVWVLKASEPAWHSFYIAKDYGRSDYATMPATLVMVMESLKNEYEVDYLNLGICTEDQGRTVNEGLFDFKESLGGSTINRYIIE